MLTVFKAILAIAEVFPIVRDWLRQFWVWYAQTRITAMKQEDRDVVLKAMLEKNQIYIEKLLGYSNAGEPSGVPGSIIVDPSELPGLSNNNPKTS